MKNYKTFDDLEFKPWLERRSASPAAFPCYEEAKQAIMEFPNGYGVSILFGDAFYSDGVSTYELAVLLEGHLVYPGEVCPDDDVLGYITKEQVTEAMRKIQDFK